MPQIKNNFFANIDGSVMLNRITLKNKQKTKNKKPKNKEEKGKELTY